VGDAFFIEYPFHLSPEIIKQLNGRRKIVRSASVFFRSMPMVIGHSFLPVPSVSLRDSVSIVEAKPRPTSSLETQDKGVADSVRALWRRVGTPGRELHDYPWCHLEVRAIEGKQGFKLAFIHYLT
jgi:hypothetical protein